MTAKSSGGYFLHRSRLPYLVEALGASRQDNMLTVFLILADPDWWRQACVYQIYPRSFADGNGDGIGDFKGIISKVPYLKRLGIDAVWLSPFYPSPLRDGGCELSPSTAWCLVEKGRFTNSSDDVADYREVDPRIGSLEDFDELAVALKREGIKVMVDIVPNHSSDEHVWFQEALKSPIGSNARDRYIFRDGE